MFFFLNVQNKHNFLYIIYSFFKRLCIFLQLFARDSSRSECDDQSPATTFIVGLHKMTRQVGFSAVFV